MAQIYENHDVSRVVTIYPNQLRQGTYYGTIVKKKITVNNLIAEIASENQGIASGEIERSADLILAKMRKKMAEGYAIDLEKIGVLFVGLNGAITKANPTPGELPDFVPKFSPDEELCAEVKKIQVEKIITIDNSPVINNVADTWSEDAEDSITSGKVARIEGKRLKLLGDDSGVFFAECDDNGNYSAAESEWHKAERLSRNLPASVDFYVPESLVAKKRYRLILRTRYGGGTELKMLKQAVYPKPICVTKSA